MRQPDGSIKYVDAIPLPPLEEELHSWDMSYRDLKESDFVVGQHWGRAGARKFLLHQRKGRWDFARSATEVKKMAEDYPVGAKLIENAANGPAIIWALEATVPGIIAIVPQGSKEARASAVSPQIEAGNIFLPHPAITDWVPAFIDDCASFPNGAHDDTVDSMSQALNRMTKAQVLRMYPEFRAHPQPGEPPEACHVIPVRTLEPWWQRWVSIGWSHEGPVIHWYCQQPGAAMHVYREHQMEDLNGADTGAMAAEGSLGELESTKSLTVYLDPQFFDDSAAGKSLAQEIGTGVSKVLGQSSAFTFEYTEDERQMPPDIAWASLERRRKKVAASRMLLRAPTGERQGGWDHIRGLLRWWPVSQPEAIPYDRELALQIQEGDDGEERLKAYLRHCAGPETHEPLPGLLIHEGCPLLIAALSSLERDEKKPGDVAVRNAAAESFLVGVMGAQILREQRPPVEAVVAQRLEALKARIPNPDANQIFSVAQKAEADFNKKKPMTGYRFPRLPKMPNR